MSRILQARIAELRQRRALLAERAEAQRLELSAACLEFERPLRWVRVGARAIAFLRNSPRFAALSTAAGILVVPRLSMLRAWLARALMFYQLGNTIKHGWHRHKEQQSAPVETAT